MIVYLKDKNGRTWRHECESVIVENAFRAVEDMLDAVTLTIPSKHKNDALVQMKFCIPLTDKQESDL